MAPNKEYLELTFVAETVTGKGNNTQIVMENRGDGTFRVTDGRIGITIGRYKPRVYALPMSQWDTFYDSRIERGYILTKQKKMDKKVVTTKSSSLDGAYYKPLSDREVAEIIERLTSYVNQAIEDNFTVKVEDISDEMIDLGSSILKELATGMKTMSVAEFNGKLKTLYAAIPRRIDNLAKKLAARPGEFNDIVADEQELYDLMIAQVRDSNAEVTLQGTILDAKGLEWRVVTPEEEKMLKKRMGSESGRYVKAWRIINKATEKRFNDFCKRENLTEENGISHLFHGSRSENFWSIITNGLTINPTGVVITGKMFGNGTYFAPDACKSMGYTSRAGSRWANGTQNTGFLGVYKVATGNPCEPKNVSHYNYDSLKKDNKHCVWCKRGGQIGLRMDEVVVYQDCQDTVEYLIEVGF